MSRVSQLYDLQQIDSALDSRAARLRQIDEEMGDTPALIIARSTHQEAQSQLAGRQAELRKLSHDVEDTTTRLRIQEKRLYDGKIKNPKELSAVQEEVGHLKSRLKQQEDDTIEAMLAVEAAEEAANARGQELEIALKESQQYKDGLMEERDKLTSQVKVLQVKRQRIITTLPWADLQVYERLRRSKHGVAVAGVQRGLCDGCHVAVPAHVLR